jgi:hypothetical protein
MCSRVPGTVCTTTIHGADGYRRAAIVRRRANGSALCSAVCAGVPAALPDVHQLGSVQVCDRGRATAVLPAATLLPATGLLPCSARVLPLPVSLPRTLLHGVLLPV